MAPCRRPSRLRHHRQPTTTSMPTIFAPSTAGRSAWLQVFWPAWSMSGIPADWHRFWVDPRLPPVLLSQGFLATGVASSWPSRGHQWLPRPPRLKHKLMSPTLGRLGHKWCLIVIASSSQNKGWPLHHGKRCLTCE